MKKILAIILVLTLALAVAACKNEPQDENTTSEKTTENSPAPENTEPSDTPTGSTVVEEDGQRHYYLEDGAEFCTEILDDAGKLTQRLAYRDGALHRSWEYDYSDSGELYRVNEYNADGDEVGCFYCDGAALVTEMTDQGLKDSYYEDGILVKTGEYTHAWATLEATYDQGVLEYSCEYDADGCLVAETHYEKGLAFWSVRYGDIEETAFYNEKGQMIQQFGFEDWREIWCRSFTYDENGAVIEEILEETADNENVDERKRYVYDENDVRAYTAMEGLIYSARYDEQGRVLWETHGCPYGAYSEFTDDTSYEYNDDGSYTAIWVGATSGRYYSNYDKDGNLLDYYGGQDPDDSDDLGEMEYWEHYQYNQYGDQISREEYAYGVLMSSLRFEYVYDQHGNWIEMVSYQDGEQSARTFRTYDDQGHVTEAVSEDGVYRCTYTYDEAGNLTEKQEELELDTVPYTGIDTYIYDEAGRLSQEIRRSVAA